MCFRSVHDFARVRLLHGRWGGGLRSSEEEGTTAVWGGRSVQDGRQWMGDAGECLSRIAFGPGTALGRAVCSAMHGHGQVALRELLLIDTRKDTHERYTEDTNSKIHVSVSC